MTSRGRTSRRRGGDDNNDAAVAATPAVSSAWADFMKEEGVTDTIAAATTGGESGTTKDSTESSRVYKLPEIHKKKKKKEASGVLVQSGTLDCRILGRSKKINVNDKHFLGVPTILLRHTKITKVVAAGHACHTLALAENGDVYGWGRNEQNQLSSALPSNVFVPTLLPDLPKGRVQEAAVGKSHTMLLIQNTIYAAGSNKVGQCGLKNLEHSSSFKQCQADAQFVQVSCGEDFSVAVCSEGYMYSTGSGEFGQLGNGSTGEHFITANKIAFVNEKSFTKQSTFRHAPHEKLHVNNDQTTKIVDLAEDIRIRQVSCGKHHVLALEAESDRLSRVFSWGCGNYGVLGHGVQADEYYPRNIGVLANLASLGPAKVATGPNCSMLQTKQGHVYYWGKHRSVGEATMRPTLVDVLANNRHVVTHSGAGGQTVVCTTANGATVAWGQGQYGELGLGDKKSSAKPTFVEGMDGCRVLSLACGFGTTAYVVENDAKVVNKLPELESDAVDGLAD